MNLEEFVKPLTETTNYLVDQKDLLDKAKTLSPDKFDQLKYKNKNISSNICYG